MIYEVVFSATASGEAEDWLEHLSEYDEMTSEKYESAF
jgi:hypothetical protein